MIAHARRSLGPAWLCAAALCACAAAPPGDSASIAAALARPEIAPVVADARFVRCVRAGVSLEFGCRAPAGRRARFTVAEIDHGGPPLLDVVHEGGAAAVWTRHEITPPPREGSQVCLEFTVRPAARVAALLRRPPPRGAVFSAPWAAPAGATRSTDPRANILLVVAEGADPARLKTTPLLRRLGRRAGRVTEVVVLNAAARPRVLATRAARALAAAGYRTVAVGAVAAGAEGPGAGFRVRRRPAGASPREALDEGLAELEWSGRRGPWFIAVDAAARGEEMTSGVEALAAGLVGWIAREGLLEQTVVVLVTTTPGGKERGAAASPRGTYEGDSRATFVVNRPVNLIRNARR